MWSSWSPSIAGAAKMTKSQHSSHPVSSFPPQVYGLTWVFFVFRSVSSSFYCSSGYRVYNVMYVISLSPSLSLLSLHAPFPFFFLYMTGHILLLLSLAFIFVQHLGVRLRHHRGHLGSRLRIHLHWPLEWVACLRRSAQALRSWSFPGGICSFGTAHRLVWAGVRSVLARTSRWRHPQERHSGRSRE